LNGVVKSLVARVLSSVLTGSSGGMLSDMSGVLSLVLAGVLGLVLASTRGMVGLGWRLGLSTALDLTVNGAELVLHRLRNGRLFGRMAGRRPASLLGLVLDNVDGVLGFDPASCWQGLAVGRLVRGVGGLDLFGDHIVLAVFGRAEGVGRGRGGLGGIVGWLL
jgi:hypothetical protein